MHGSRGVNPLYSFGDGRAGSAARNQPAAASMVCDAIRTDAASCSETSRNCASTTAPGGTAGSPANAISPANVGKLAEGAGIGGRLQRTDAHRNSFIRAAGGSEG